MNPFPIKSTIVLEYEDRTETYDATLSGSIDFNHQHLDYPTVTVTAESLANEVKVKYKSLKDVATRDEEQRQREADAKRNRKLERNFAFARDSLRSIFGRRVEVEMVKASWGDVYLLDQFYVPELDGYVYVRENEDAPEVRTADGEKVENLALYRHRGITLGQHWSRLARPADFTPYFRGD